MDRVSGWYKRRAQIFILIIGLVVVIFLNADTVDIFKALNSDKSLRETTVAAAIKANEQNSTSSATFTNCPTPACDKDKNSPECKLQQNRCQLQQIGLPIGWNSGDDPRRQFRGWADVVPKRKTTSLAGFDRIGDFARRSFWFDMLNKLIVERSTVRTEEGVPEEVEGLGSKTAEQSKREGVATMIGSITDRLKYQGTPGETVTITVTAVPSGDVPTSEAPATSLSHQTALSFQLVPGDNRLELTLDSKNKDGDAFHVVVRPVQNEDNNECVHDFNYHGIFRALDFSFAA